MKPKNVNIIFFSERNEHSFDNAIENISTKHVNNISTNILSSNQIHVEIDVKFFLKDFFFFFLICEWKNKKL
jgi:hypothetical protein